MSVHRRLFNASSRRRDSVAQPRPSSETRESGGTPDAAHDDYVTEVFGAIRDEPDSADADSGPDVADEWEKALRGEPANDRAQPNEHADHDSDQHNSDQHNSDEHNSDEHNSDEHNSDEHANGEYPDDEHTHYEHVVDERTNGEYPDDEHTHYEHLVDEHDSDRRLDDEHVHYDYVADEHDSDRPVADEHADYEHEGDAHAVADDHHNGELVTEGHDGYDEHDGFEGFDQPAQPAESAHPEPPNRSVDPAGGSARWDEYDDDDGHPDQSVAAHHQAQTQNFARYVDEDSSAGPGDTQEEHDLGSARHDQPAEGLSFIPSDDPARENDSETGAGSDVPAQLFGHHSGTDERMDTAIIPRFVDEEDFPNPSQHQDGAADDEYPSDGHDSAEHLGDEHQDYLQPTDFPDALHSEQAQPEQPSAQPVADGDQPDAIGHQEPSEDAELPGETTEMIPAYRSEEDADEAPAVVTEPEPTVEPASTPKKSVADPVGAGPAKWERARRTAEPAEAQPQPEPVGLRADDEKSGERTERIAAYRDDQPAESVAPMADVGQQEPSSQTPASDPSAQPQQDSGPAKGGKRDRSSGPESVGTSAPSAGGAAAVGLAGAAAVGLERRAARRGQAVDTGGRGSQSEADLAPEPGRKAPRKDGKVRGADPGAGVTQAERPTATEAPGRASRPRSRTNAEGAARDSAAATEVMPTYRDDDPRRARPRPNRPGQAALADAELKPEAKPKDEAKPKAKPRSEADRGMVASSAPAPAPAQRKPVGLVLVLLLVAVACGVGAYFMRGAATEASLAYPTNNQALIDKPATEQVTAAVSTAIESAYSYDYRQLDANENRTLGLLTGSYVDEYKGNFAQIRQIAPQTQLELQSTVSQIGVETLNDDDAKLLVRLDQAVRQGGNPNPTAGHIQLSVTAEKVDGQWKVSGVTKE